MNVHNKADTLETEAFSLFRTTKLRQSKNGKHEELVSESERNISCLNSLSLN